MKYHFWKTVIAYLFIFLFVYTAFSKWMDFARFRWVLEDSPLLAPVAFFVAIALPAVELVIALLLLLPATRKAGLFCSVVIMAIFTGYIGYMLATSSSLPCSCGGVLRSLSWSQHFVVNLFLFLLALWAYRTTRKSVSFIAQ